MNKTVLLLERPARRVFDEETRGQVEAILKTRSKELPVPVKARWHKTDPLLRLETKFVSVDIAFGPELLRVVAHLSTVGRFLDNKKNRAEALAAAEEIADAVGI